MRSAYSQSCRLLSLPARACPVGYPLHAERGERRQQRQEGDRIDCAPGEEAPGDGADAVGQEDEDLPLAAKPRRCGEPRTAPVTAITMAVRVLVKTTVVTPGRPS